MCHPSKMHGYHIHPSTMYGCHIHPSMMHDATFSVQMSFEIHFSKTQIIIYRPKFGNNKGVLLLLLSYNKLTLNGWIAMASVSCKTLSINV